MAIGYRSFSSGDVHLPGATMILTKPSGFQATDRLVAAIGSGENSGAGTFTLPAGWTAVMAHVANTKVDLVIAHAPGDVASTTFTKSGTVGDAGWVMLAFTGGDPTTPIDAVGTGSSNTGAASITTGAVTIATDQAWHVIALASWIGGTWSATGFTMRQNAGSNEDGTCGYNTTPKSVGSTGTVSCTTTGGASGQVLCCAPFALRPAAVASVYPLAPIAFQPSRTPPVPIPY